MARTWCEHGANLVRTRSVQTQWCEHGANVARTWCEHVRIPNKWCEHGANMVRTWCEHGPTMFSLYSPLSLAHAVLKKSFGDAGDDSRNTAQNHRKSTASGCEPFSHTGRALPNMKPVLPVRRGATRLLRRREAHTYGSRGATLSRRLQVLAAMHRQQSSGCRSQGC